MPVLQCHWKSVLQSFSSAILSKCLLPPWHNMTDLPFNCELQPEKKRVKKKMSINTGQSPSKWISWKIYPTLPA